MTDSPLCDGDPLARQLAALAPAPAALDRDRFLFAAGAAARDRAVRFWRRLVVAQAVLAAAVVGVGVGNPELVRAPDGREVVRVPVVPEKPVPVPREAPSSAPSQYVGAEPDDGADPAERGRLLRLRADILAGGLGALPAPAAAPTPPADVTALEKSLQLPPGVFAAPHRPTPPAARPGDSD